MYRLLVSSAIFLSVSHLFAAIYSLSPSFLFLFWLLPVLFGTVHFV